MERGEKPMISKRTRKSKQSPDKIERGNRSGPETVTITFRATVEQAKFIRSHEGYNAWLRSVIDAEKEESEYYAESIK
jgi:hypothetical protein